jgi:xylan 1,4-beta-xylosidase
VYLNSSGFNPFLFHDDDGRKWLLNMRWDFRKGRNRFSGIVLQEYSPQQQKLVGPVKTICHGTDLGVTEGPNLFKKDGYYYLLLAEGGTGYNHAATLARSKRIDGPYEFDPDYPLLTTVNAPDHPLQKAGHGSLVQTQGGEWYLSHICARPLPGRRLCPLGRETALQKVEWTADGWLRIAGGGKLPHVRVPAPDLPPHPFPEPPVTDDFDGETFGEMFYTLRIPADESWLSLKERPGFLRLYGQESLQSWHRQSMVARHLTHYRCTVETCVEFDPEHFMQMAGLVFYYDESDYFYLRIIATRRSANMSASSLAVRANTTNWSIRSQTLTAGRVAICRPWSTWIACSFSFRKTEPIGFPSVNRWIWDNCPTSMKASSGLRGRSFGMCVQDLAGTHRHADFDYFTYRPAGDE